jgi:dipeptidase E
MIGPENPATDMLLISCSTTYGRGYLDHVQSEICGLLTGIRCVVFVPFALYDRDAYTAKAAERFQRMGFGLESLHSAGSPARLIEEAEAIFVGGGNTFRLLKSLQDLDLVSLIRAKAEAGCPFIGSSAGSIVACPTLKTTKDMPVVEPRSFNALNLVNFQISPHYLDPDPRSTHMGETQEERINQYLEENSLPVVGLREPGWLRVHCGSVRLGGSVPARIFRRSMPALEVPPETVLTTCTSAQGQEA